MQEKKFNYYEILIVICIVIFCCYLLFRNILSEYKHDISIQKEYISELEQNITNNNIDNIDEKINHIYNYLEDITAYVDAMYGKIFPEDEKHNSLTVKDY